MSRRIPATHWRRLAVHGVTVERLRDGTVDDAAQFVMNTWSMPIERAREYVAAARGAAPVALRPAERAGVERVNSSIKRWLAALAREHRVSWAVATTRGIVAELSDRGVNVPGNLRRPAADGRAPTKTRSASKTP